MTTDPKLLAEIDKVLAKWHEAFKAKNAEKLHCPHGDEHKEWFELADLKFDGWSSFTYKVTGCCPAFEALVLNAATEERMFNPPTFNTGVQVLKYETENDHRAGAVQAPHRETKKTETFVEHHDGGGGHGLSEATRSNVERWFEEVWNEHDVARIRDWVSEDCKVHSLDGAFRKGPEAFEELFAILLDAMPDIHVEVKYHVVDHDKAGSLLFVSGTPKTTKTRCEFTAMTFSRWHEGKMVEAWSLADLDASLLKAREAIKPKD
jgi:ketosteroid isomerase-like protein